MRFMVIVKATAESEKEGALPDPQLMADMGKFNEELIEGCGVNIFGRTGQHFRLDVSQKNCHGINRLQGPPSFPLR